MAERSYDEVMSPGISRGALSPRRAKYTAARKRKESNGSISSMSSVEPGFRKPRERRPTIKDRLLALQVHRNSVGTWVQCCRNSCKKWRYMHDIKDASDVPEIWYCAMNTDKEHNSCDVPEVEVTEEEEMGFVYNKFSVGSIVWAKHQGYPWWPGMVDDDPDIEMFYWLSGPSDIPSHYNVVFLDQNVSRAWIPTQNIQRFTGRKCPGPTKSNSVDYAVKLRMAAERAMFALKLPVEARRREFCFVNRYKCNSVLAPSKNEDPIDEDYVPTYQKGKRAMAAPVIVVESESDEDGQEEDGMLLLSQAESMMSELDTEEETDQPFETGNKTKQFSETTEHNPPEFKMEFHSEEPSIMPYHGSYKTKSRRGNEGQPTKKRSLESSDEDVQVVSQLKMTAVNRVITPASQSPVYLQL